MERTIEEIKADIKNWESCIRRMEMSDSGWNSLKMNEYKQNLANCEAELHELENKS